MADTAADLTAGCAVLVRGLRKQYRGVTAVDGIDLEIRRSEVFALLGPNGAGKTTTIEILEATGAGTRARSRCSASTPHGLGGGGARGSAWCRRPKPRLASSPCARWSPTSVRISPTPGTRTR